jgi:hypothetical protein
MRFAALVMTYLYGDAAHHVPPDDKAGAAADVLPVPQ